MKYLLTIAFDGRDFCGFQIQKNGVSVQETLCRAVETVMGNPYPVTGCSRTDSGVHATGFRATVETDDGAPVIPPEKLPMALNGALPESVSVRDAILVPDTIHARYAVKRKEDRYRIHHAPTRDPFLVGRAWFYPRPLRDTLMAETLSYAVGTHDFRSFMAAGSDISETVRTVFDARVDRCGELVTITVEGNGFLYHMVRILVGTAVAASEGKIVPADMPAILAACDRRAAGPTAPACGLYLTNVIY